MDVSLSELQELVMDREAWPLRTQGSDAAGALERRAFHFHALEKEMATHAGVLAWRISGTGEPGGLPSMGSRRVGHD